MRLVHWLRIGHKEKTSSALTLNRLVYHLIYKGRCYRIQWFHNDNIIIIYTQNQKRYRNKIKDESYRKQSHCIILN